mmetsp:Transcript_29956/g.47842  ORF Transcript_29956/g.47842 Transcript_29956/m.47842 type:complete len:355 (-) Transcript_29956:8-1072(-)
MLAETRQSRRRSLREESRERRAEIVEQPKEVSVLQDSDHLQKAALEASKGGKKKILGLYTPDGSRIDTNVKVETHLQQARKEHEQLDLAGLKTGLKLKSANILEKKDHVLDAAKKKENLAEVAQAYSKNREFRQKRAAKERRSEESIEDEEAEKIAKGIMGKTNIREQQGFEKLFNFFDVDKDQTWGSIEFAQRMTDIGFPTGVEDAANLLYFAGVRDVDRITYNDFLAMMPKLKAFRRLIEKDAMKAFSVYDNGSGFISKRALREVIHRLSGPEPMEKAYVDALCKKADRENTDRIPFDFFIRAMFGSPPLIPYQKDPSTIRTPFQQALASFGRCCGAAPKRNSGDRAEDNRY